MPINKIPLDFNHKDSLSVANMHNALTKLNFSVSENEKNEKNEKKTAVSTIEVVKKFQTANNLIASGELDAKTISLMNIELQDKM